MDKIQRCELCSHRAQIYCQSDQANLCYDCDRSIHSANFLVAKHSRSLLCSRCQSPTPWIASGLDLGRAASVCVDCLRQPSSQRRLPEGETSRRENDCDMFDDVEEGGGETDEDEDEEYGDEDKDEDGENQVVPWKDVASPPTAVCSSVSEELSSSDCFSSPDKRKSVDANFDSEDDTVYSLERFNREARTEIDEDLSNHLR